MKLLVLCIPFLFLAFAPGCRKAVPVAPAPPADDTLHFITRNYIDLSAIAAVSRFRSGEGHDYSDDFESCRSMKHYFLPEDSADWSAITIVSPVDGIIVRLFDEWAGTQFQIQIRDHPSYTIAIFHVRAAQSFTEGDTVRAGQLLGTHIGPQTMSDIAVRRQEQDKSRLISFFDVIADKVFDEFRARGVRLRGDCIISREARDADTLRCAGDAFQDKGTLPNWVALN